ncbi:hypothetical protein M8J77_002093 [Diaphorina citri]|nr:hypothetical protein M8J77_002093 [Diaphorina citri]
MRRNACAQTNEARVMNSNVIAYGSVCRDVKLHDLPSATAHSLRSTSVDVTITEIGGDVITTEIGGDVTITEIGGDVITTEIGGDVTITEIGGDVTITEIGGDVTITEIGGDKITEIGDDKTTVFTLSCEPESYKDHSPYSSCLCRNGHKTPSDRKDLLFSATG